MDIDDDLRIGSSKKKKVKGKEGTLKKIASNIEAAKVHLQHVRDLVASEKLDSDELERIIASLAAFAGEAYERGISIQSPTKCSY